MVHPELKNKKLKILEITKYFYPNKGGIESNVLGIAEELVSRYEEVMVLSANHPKTKKEETYFGIKIRRSSILFTLFRDPFTPGMLKDLLSEDYDLIHLHLPDPFNSLFAYLASVIKGRPLVVTYHADIIKKERYYKPFVFIYNFFQNIVLSHAKFILATTPNYARESPILKKFNKKIWIVPNFVDKERFSKRVTNYSIEKLRKKYSLYNKKIILFLGRLIPYKGVKYLIKAFPKIKEKVPDSVLVIAGDGPLKKELVKESYGMSDVIFIPPPKDEEIPVLLKACELFILPSVTRQEAFGIVLLEAMVMEKPVISTNISGMPYVVGDGGLLVPPKDPDALSDAIIKILSNDNLKEKLGIKAKNRVEENFTKEIIVDELERVFDEVL